MSHTNRRTNIGNSALVESNIIDYTAGGEAYTLAELGITGPITGAFFLSQDTWIGDIKGIIRPRLVGANIILEVGPSIELPSTIGLNYTFIAIVHGA